MSETTKNFRPQVTQVEVPADLEGQRIDNYLMRLLKGIPRSHVYRILRRGEVRVNKGRIKAAYRVKAGDRIRIPPLNLVPAQAKPKTPTALLEVLANSLLFEDSRLLAINKPAGLAVHGGSGVSLGVIEMLRELRPQGPRLELVHRLDRETSGCLLVSKRHSALRELHELLRANAIDKRYLALVAGTLQQEVLDIKVPLRKNTLQGGERVVRADAEGKSAHTRVRVLQRFSGATLIEVQLFTGRTHQIRVHATHIGHPLVGDEKYGDTELNRRFRQQGFRGMFLHAQSLTFPWSTDKRNLKIIAPAPDNFEKYLSRQQDIT